MTDQELIEAVAKRRIKMCNYFNNRCSSSSLSNDLVRPNPIYPKSWIMQEDIDKIESTTVHLPWFKRALRWLAACPGGWMTIITLIAFAAGIWGMWLWWNVAEKLVSAGVKG